MADYKFTAALNARSIPPIARAQPRSIVIGHLDNRLRNPMAQNAQDFPDNNPQGLPQVLYAENVMPTLEGLISVAYVDKGTVFPSAGVADDAVTIYDKSGAARLLCPASGRNFVKSIPTDPWVTYPAPGAPYSGIRWSTAYVNGVSYVCYDSTALLEWDETVPGMVDTTPSILGVASTDLRAICSSGNYMIGINKTDNSIVWSSLTNALDFVPDISTGAGTQIPVDMKGFPIYLTSLSGGFLIHCTHNIVAAVYTQNAAQPWIFREVKGSGGVIDGDLAGLSKTNNSASTYTITSHGLQTANLRESEILFSDVMDYLSGTAFEIYSSVTKRLSLVVTPRIPAKLAVLANRYIFISYIVNGVSYSNILVYDLELRRWGRLKIEHVAVFYYNQLDTSQRDFFYILLNTGQIKRVHMNVGQSASAVLILGRYQLNRTSQICSQDLELEMIDANDDVTVNVISNYNGATFGQKLQMTLYEDTDNYRHYQGQLEGENISFVIEGTFHISTALLTVTKGAAF